MFCQEGGGDHSAANQVPWFCSFYLITREEGGVDLKAIGRDFRLAAVTWFRIRVGRNTSASRRSGDSFTIKKVEKAG